MPTDCAVKTDVGHKSSVGYHATRHNPGVGIILANGIFG